MLTDEDFKRRLSTGKKWEHYIAEELVNEGLPAMVPSDSGIEEGKDKEYFAKFDTDIVVGDKILEVKSRADTCIFSGPEDFPFSDIFIDTEGGWEKKERKPDYYVVVSQKTGGSLVVPGDTRDQWNSRKVYDKTCGFATKTLVAKKGLAKPFSWMVDELKNSSEKC